MKRVFTLAFLFSLLTFSAHAQLKVTPLTTNSVPNGTAGQSIKSLGNGVIQWTSDTLNALLGLTNLNSANLTALNITSNNVIANLNALNITSNNVTANLAALNIVSNRATANLNALNTVSNTVNNLSNSVDVVSNKNTATLTALNTVSNAFYGASVGVTNVMSYGAKGDGVTDDTTAFQNALNWGGLIYVPFTTNGYLISSTLTVGSNTFLSGLSGRPKLTFKNTANGYLLDCGTNSMLSIVNIELDGGSNQTFITITTTNGRSGIRAFPYGSVSIRDCEIHGFGGVGVDLTQPVGSSAVGFVDASAHTILSSSRIYYCGVGLRLDDSKAEYQIVSTIETRKCYKGIEVLSGNFNLSGSASLENNFGIYLSGTNNNGHGNANGCIFNHNNYPIYATNITYGFNFVGCQIWQGNVVLHTCKAVNISDGTLDVDNLCITNGTWNRIHDNWSNASYTNASVVSGGNHYFFNNKTAANMPIYGSASFTSLGTNILALVDQGGGGSEEFRVYNTASTEWGFMKWSGNILFVGTTQSGGNNRAYGLATANTPRWLVQTTGHFEPNADQTYNIGSASLQVSNIHSRALTLGTNNGAAANTLPLATAPSAGASYFWNSNGVLFLLSSAAGSTTWNNTQAVANASLAFPSTNFIPSSGFSGTRYTNGFNQIGLLMVTFSFVDATTGTPIVRAVIEQNGAGGAKTNTFPFSMVGGTLTTVTNVVSLGFVNPGAVVTITDISSGSGASVGVVNSELELR